MGFIYILKQWSASSHLRAGNMTFELCQVVSGTSRYSTNKMQHSIWEYIVPLNSLKPFGVMEGA